MKVMRLVLFLTSLVSVALGDCSFPNANNVTELAVAYQAPALQQLDVADAYKLYICEKGMFQGFSALRFEMIFPMNPQCQNRNLGCAFIEVYNHTDVNNTGAGPFVTNYVGDMWQWPDIVIPWDDNNQPVDADGYIYMKVFSEMSYTLQAEVRVSPTNDAAQGCFLGKDAECYQVRSQVSSPLQEMGNFFQLQAVETVPNFSNCLFGLNLCFDYSKGELPTLAITVSAVFSPKLDVKEPYSAFNAFLCSRDENSNNPGQKYCIPDGSAVLCDVYGACYWDRATPFVNLEVDGKTIDKDGRKEAVPLVLSIVGMGGNTNGLNSFIITADMQERR